MKTFKSYRNAHTAAEGGPILRVGFGKAALFIVGFGDPAAAKLTEVGLIIPGQGIAGHVTLGHLDRLGNANHADPRSPIPQVTAFPKPT